MQATPNRNTGRGVRIAYRRHVWLLIICLLPLAFVVAPAVAASSDDGPAPDPNAGADDKALVEFHLPNREAIDLLVAAGADLAEYQRENADGSVTVNAIVTPSLRAYYESLGFQAGATIEDRSTWEAAKADREAAIAAEKRSRSAAELGRRPGRLERRGI